MAQASRTETFDVDINKLYDTIVDYASYPDFVDGCSSVNVIEQTEAGAKVEYGLNLIKKFKYTLILKHEKPNRVSWTFDSGDLFKMNEGSWELKDNGDGTTEVTYSLEVDIKGFAPKKIVDNLTSKNLPAMMTSYKNRAKSRG
ncbi:MAG: cyclase [Halobacteriovorax sp.]|nr:cyclase [Halobacteriovorax sp.]|tara:strand:+ start:116973 stop:117401 length:429 start_codon:yes stop_codon:yes gene_type:complete